MRFAPIVMVALVVVGLVWSGVLKHLSLSELRVRHNELTAYVQAEPALSVMIFFACDVALIALSIPGGALILTLTAGFLFGPLVGALIGLFATTLGAVIIFLISRLAVGDALERGVGARIRAFEAGIRKDAFFYLLTLRLIPVTPFWLVNLAAGLLSIRLSTFFWSTILGILPATIVYAGIGSGFGRIFARGGEPQLHDLLAPQIALPLAGLAVISVLPIIHQRWRARRAATAASVAERAGLQ